ncbi:MAG: ABC transporter ATP-binding protein [Patescibacteria group bacterium]|jgi:ABC-2 type transport system ATP-binding protein
MIELTNVSKKFDSNLVIDNVSLKIKTGEIVGLLGPNGAGKTTTVRMIAGVLPPTKGRVVVNNQDLFAEEVENKPHIGYLPENNPIYDDMTVEEFLKMWADLKNIPAQEREAAIAEVVEAAGLEAVFYRPISELSKGYKQRTGLAQAILSQPDVLLLDEPTEGLDPNQRREIHDLIKGIGKKRTVIICSHVLPEITKMCSRIIIISRGKIVADSTTRELGVLSEGRQVYEFVAKGKAIRKDIKDLPGVVEVTQEKDGIATRWTVVSESKRDLRLPIFKLAVKKKWDLYELVQKQQDLEDVFARLTKES